MIFKEKNSNTWQLEGDSILDIVQEMSVAENTKVIQLDKTTTKINKSAQDYPL